MKQISLETQKQLAERFLYPPQQRDTPPVLYAMAGIPASGKSTFVDQQQEQGGLPHPAFILDPDRLMNALADYQTDVRTLGSEAAFQNWELPARELAYDLLSQAQSQRLDIIQDMGNVREENLLKLSALKADGYELKIFYIHVDVQTALERARHRERHTPTAMIKERHDALCLLLPRLIGIADEFQAFDNSSRTAPYTRMSERDLKALPRTF